MKISEMVIREDFYTINRKTLDAYYNNSENTSVLFVYPELNAIITRKPSISVKKYLFNEYNIRGNYVKKSFARAYVFVCMNSYGFFARKKIIVNTAENPDILIYPCNKKYRIFNFKEGYVDVITKADFKCHNIQHEIEFRSKKSLPGFVIPIISFGENTYRESIIDGMPLARLNTNFAELRDNAYRLLKNYTIDNEVSVIDSNDYVSKMQRQICSSSIFQKIQNEDIQDVINKISKIACTNKPINIVFSHGDLQAGNIWIENKTKRIYIIDWESWGYRSEFYDKAVLFLNLRPGGVIQYFQSNTPLAEKAIVLLEDIVYHLHESNQLPIEIGTKEFKQYMMDVIKITGQYSE